MSDAEMQALLGNIPANADYLPQLVNQFGTRAGILPFVGAGMSMSFNLPGWSFFLLDLAKEAGNVEATKDHLNASRYEEAAAGVLEGLGPRRFQDLLAKNFGDQKLEGRTLWGAVGELAKFPSGPIITTNFDRVIETAFAQAGRNLTPYTHAQAKKGIEALQQDRPFLLKLHGDWADPATRILTLEEYKAAYGDTTGRDITFTLPLPTLLFQLMTSRCCLFLGCSLKQDRTVTILRSIARGNPDLVHYAIVERPASEDEFRRRAAELSGQSIRPVWFPTGKFELMQPLLAYLADKAAQGLQRLAAKLVTRTSSGKQVQNNIPVLATPTIGRDDEVRQVEDMLRVARFVTITGVGGSGKSRLAIEVAKAVKENYEDGVWFIPLAELAKKADKERVLPSRVGKIIGVPEQANRPPLESLADHLAVGTYLIVLDNCEHLIDSCRELASFLLPKCPDLTILATSRRPLNRSAGANTHPLSQERLYPLAPLDTPPPEITDFDEIAANESVALFVQRAEQRAPGWKLRPENAESVAALCRALDGVPLGIEVTAARLAVKSAQDLEATSRHLLTAVGNVRAGDLRPWKTLTAALRWSYGLLRPSEQLFMRSMAVFDGGWTEQSAEAVYPRPEHDTTSVLDYLQALHENSLVVTTELNESKRFRFLEPVRQLVQMQLAADERQECERRHAEFFLNLAETAAPELLMANQIQWLDRLQIEVDNLRAAIRWSAAQKEAERGLRLIAALWRFTEIRGYYREGRARAEDVLRIEGADRFPALVSKVLSGAGMLAYRQADFDAADTMFARSLAMEKELGNSAGIANALNDLGNVSNMKGDFTRARDLYMESLDIERKNGNQRAVAVAQFNLGNVAVGVGQYDEAERWLTDSLRDFRENGNHRESAFPLNTLGQLATATGQLDLAEEYAQESLEIRKKVKDTKGIADTLRTAGWASVERGDYNLAGDRLSESISLARGIGDRRGVAETLELFGLLFARTGRYLQAVESFAAAEQIRHGFNYALPPIRIERRESTLAQAKEILGTQSYDRAWRRGMSASFSDAVDKVLRQDAAGMSH